MNTEKHITLPYINFSVPIEKEGTIIGKKRKRNHKNLFYRLQFVDSVQFMATLLSSVVNNFAEGIHKIKCAQTKINKVKLVE